MVNDTGTGWNINRRSLLIGGGAGVGLLVAWGVWPRDYRPNLNAAPGETIFNAFLKIGIDGHITIIVPQAEMGQGVTTALPQILADELGADWRTIGVETAPINPLYANDFFIAERAKTMPGWPLGSGEWTLRQIAIRSAMMITAGSTSIRGFEQRYREAGATARALLCKAAGKRWDADWQACDTAQGFVTRGNDKLRFAELAAEAALLDPPGNIALRTPGQGGISGKSVPRIDLPSKVDGSARFAGDVRLPELVYASVRHGPFGKTRLMPVDQRKAEAVAGVLAVMQNPGWVAAVATNWWAANRALDALAPTFRTDGPLPDDVSIKTALETALASGKGKRFIDEGDTDGTLAGGVVVSADYRMPLAVHAPLETLTATARVTGDRIEVWMPTQAPNLARRDVARAIGIAETSVTIYPMLVGGGFGRKLVNEAAVVAAIIAGKMRRPVQLVWSRGEDIRRDHFRPAAIGRLKARLGENGGAPLAWSALIAAPSTDAEQFGDMIPGFGASPENPEAAAVEGARPAYAIPAVAIEHRVAPLGVRTGLWPSGAHSYTCFFTESFVDELAQKAGVEPLSYRMQMLGSAPRLARCLTTVATLGNWQGGIQGSGQGIAAHSCFGSHIAMLIEAHVGDGGMIQVDRVVAVVDCGRVINPEIVHQQIEGGIIWGLSGALGDAISIQRGLVSARNFNQLGLLRLSTTPEILVEIIQNEEDPGGVSDLAVPTVAPALANAIFAATGKRLRTLPLRIGNA